MGVGVQFGANMRLKAQNGTISASGTPLNHVTFKTPSGPLGFGIELDWDYVRAHTVDTRVSSR